MLLKKITHPIILLRLFLGIVFLSAGVYRLFHWQEALTEFHQLGIPFIYPLLYAMVALEMIGGLCLIINVKTRIVTLIFAFFLAAALIQALLVSGTSIINGFGELFFFHANATDF